MNSPTGNQGKASDSQTDTGGINMSSLCRTLARVLVNLDEGGYTEEVRQDTVLQHDASPDPASDTDTREAK